MSVTILYAGIAQVTTFGKTENLSTKSGQIDVAKR
jgi:hypothetical protein